jgi:hypothetical protein
MLDCNAKWLKNGKLRKAILSAFYNISQRNFGILLILWCSFKLWWNFCPDLSRSKFHSKGERSITKNAAQTWSSRRFSKGASGSHLMTHVWSRSTVTVEGSVCGSSQPTLSTFPVGENRSTRRKPTTAERWMTLFTEVSCVRSENRTHDLRGSDDCDTETPKRARPKEWRHFKCYVNKFFVGLHGDKTYNTFCLWKRHVNLLLQSFLGLRIESFAVINLRGVSTNTKSIVMLPYFLFFF